MDARFVTEVTRWYAGIGSRKTPQEILDMQTRIARKLAALGWGCRSGGADGSDKAYEAGAGDAKQIFVPRDHYKGYRQIYPIPDEAYEMVGRFHPAWAYLNDEKKAMISDLMARNAQQILGPTLHEYSEFVSCWTPDGIEDGKFRTSKSGGTGQAISIASAYGIPVFNLGNPTTFTRFQKFLEAP